MQLAFLIETQRPHFPGWFTAHMSSLVQRSATNKWYFLTFHQRRSLPRAKTLIKVWVSFSFLQILVTLQIDHLATSRIQVLSFHPLLSVRGISWPAGWWMWGSLLLSKSFSKSLLVVLSKSFSKSLSEVLSTSLPQKRISAVDIEVGQQQKSDSSAF